MSQQQVGPCAQAAKPPAGAQQVLLLPASLHVGTSIYPVVSALS